MMRQYELVERVKRYNPNADEALLDKAYVYGMMKHGAQKRASGDPYFSHPLEVAAILTDLRFDDASIAVALLHDTIEDTDATRSEIDALFGEEIGSLVESLTKLKKLDFVSKKTEQAENFRRLLLAVADDVRVLIVKLADRLHNMRTLHFVPEAKRFRISEETMEIYAPLAGRLGMQGMREELEDLAFRYMNPEAYKTIQARLEALSERNRDLASVIEQALTEKLGASAIVAKVKGRMKRPYSIFVKMQRKGVSFEQLSDVYGFRVLVPSLDECYHTLGIVHSTWPMVPGRFKDYVSTPKQNDYRSIHTTVVGPGRQRVELQIRTEEMHRIAEYGIAAHALYKDGDRISGGRNIARLTEASGAYAWLRDTIERLNDPNLNPEEFLENTKLELFHDQVFCFTPKGKIIALPRGATPIDFAYAVHTDVGNTCVGAKVNGRIMPLMTELSNGDEVDIIRSKAQVPPPAWEQIAVTGKARAAIRRATREAVRKQFGGLGRQILARSFDRAGRTFAETALEPVIHRLGHSSIQDIIAAVGRGELTSEAVLKAVYPDYQDERASSNPKAGAGEGWFGVGAGGKMKFRVPGAASAPDAERSIPIRGLAGDLPVIFAPNGGAVPGDRIVGILTPGQGITIYPIQSPDLKEFDDQPDRWLDVRWDIDPNDPVRFPARIALTSLNEPGSLAQIAQVIADNDGNIDNIKMIRKGADFHEILIDLEVWDLKHLTRITNQLRSKPIISSVERVNG
ncbi:RelA/SpoT family protein [Prosthecomicrobium hirschii]|uniref:GTP pyrophosphokinase rsh n=1 Tax=Prosthecodimorpha hirschii TaxID=665126 RepID=A0A0P6WJG4_9HYPH|nr:bifunctional (p)ppGpp synthetase/guanosine-3',5'-bis(diphosphate) 3'-pyrophosphohydrolase [Prosthecomicrobium hirschii]KPL54918.1 GTP pyrophosphokinase [Prosthecomicrobium hirschii]MCW1840173.1 bifunctional (p)ppGpp synthetase/guanosine-3',5'-bis(diphosphate) 3'-pyrophosphohydrolase [Prosthecomicrobium hirschii]